jgi:hypothetical protein
MELHNNASGHAPWRPKAPVATAICVPPVLNHEDRTVRLYSCRCLTASGQAHVPTALGTVHFCAAPHCKAPTPLAGVQLPAAPAPRYQRRPWCMLDSIVRHANQQLHAAKHHIIGGPTAFSCTSLLPPAVAIVCAQLIIRHANRSSTLLCTTPSAGLQLSAAQALRHRQLQSCMLDLIVRHANPQRHAARHHIIGGPAASSCKSPSPLASPSAAATVCARLNRRASAATIDAPANAAHTSLP